MSRPIIISNDIDVIGVDEDLEGVVFWSADFLLLEKLASDMGLNVCSEERGHWSINDGDENFGEILVAARSNGYLMSIHPIKLFRVGER